LRCEDGLSVWWSLSTLLIVNTATAADRPFLTCNFLKSFNFTIGTALMFRVGFMSA